MGARGSNYFKVGWRLRLGGHLVTPLALSSAMESICVRTSMLYYWNSVRTATFVFFDFLSLSDYHAYKGINDRL